MKESYWGYWLILLGVFVVVIMMLIQNMTKNSTEDNYNLKSITEAAMVDSIDYAYYRDFGEVKINKEKFCANFVRRFAEVVSSSSEYEVLCTGIHEAPPKVSVEIKSKTGVFNIASDSTQFDITSRIDERLELKGANNNE